VSSDFVAQIKRAFTESDAIETRTAIIRKAVLRTSWAASITIKVTV